MSALRPHRKGTVFDILSEVRADGEVVWTESTTLLSRGPGTPSAHADLLPDPLLAPTASWDLRANLGRRYAAASGDRNLIHLFKLSAQAFGFPRQIAHGMWSKARCVAALENRLPEAVRVDVAFKTPILLPATVRFHADTEGDQQRFTLANPKSGAPHVVGRAAHV